MVESRAAHLAQPEEGADAGAAEDGDVVRLNGKPRKAKKKKQTDRDLL
jgi:hypothetical protein